MQISEIISTLVNITRYLKHKVKKGKAEMVDTMHLENLEAVTAALLQHKKDYFEARAKAKRLDEIELQLDAADLTINDAIVIAELYHRHLKHLDVAQLDKALAYIQAHNNQLLFNQTA